jgi:hypothetical protein
VNQVFSKEALRSIVGVFSTMNWIVSRWVFEDPLWSNFGTLLSSKRFLGQIQLKFFSKASWIPTSLQDIGTLKSSLVVPTTSTCEPSLLKHLKLS